MAIQANKPNSRVFLLLGVVLAAAAAVAVLLLVRSNAPANEVSVVVSEETGSISIARNGRMVRNLDHARLSKILQMFTNSDASRDF